MMFSGKDTGSYPTQWALNPSAYQNVDASQVDWAALAQQWMAMKEAAAIIAAPPPPSMKPEAEKGEAPMEVENPDPIINEELPNNASEWETTGNGNSWGDSWNQWGWGWSNSETTDVKLAPDPSMAIPPMADVYTGPASNSSILPGYTTNNANAPTFQHGYWTAPPVDQSSSRSSSSSRDRNTKSRNRERPSRAQRVPRDKVPLLPVIEPMVTPAVPVMDAAKRRQLPAWIREGLEKMEREKQKAIEREQEKLAQAEAEREKKILEEEELKRMKAAASGEPMLPPKSKFESDSEGEAETAEKEQAVSNNVPEATDADAVVKVEIEDSEQPPLIKKSPEEIMQEVMLAVRRSLTEILLEVTDQEIHTVSQEEFARYSTAQASRLNAMKASKSKALAAISSGLGLGAYESSSEESADEDENDVTDQQLQDIIRRKKIEFERTSREIEAEVRRAEQKEAGEDASTPISGTPEKPRVSRSSATPPPLSYDRETPEKISVRRVSKDKRDHKNIDRIDGYRKLETIPEERSKRPSRRDGTPSPQHNTKIEEESSSSSSDSSDSSSSSSSSSSSESDEEIVESRKRKRKTSSSEESRKKSKRSKEKHQRDHHSKVSRPESYEKTEKSKTKKRDYYYEKHKSSKGREYEKSRKEKYRDDSDEDKYRKRSKRSRSISYESRSGRKKGSRDRSAEKSKRREKRSYDRESSRRDRSYERSSRDYEKYDRYERSRDYDRKRSRSHSRHRR